MDFVWRWTSNSSQPEASYPSCRQGRTGTLHLAFAFCRSRRGAMSLMVQMVETYAATDGDIALGRLMEELLMG